MVPVTNMRYGYETDSQRVTWTRFAILVFTPWARLYLFNGGQSWESLFSCLEQVSKTEAERGCVKCSKSGITLWRPLLTDVRRKGGGVGVQQEGLLVPSKAKSGEQPAWNWAHITRSPFLSTFCTVLYVAIWRQTTNGKCIVIEVWGSSNIVLSKN